MAKKAEQNQTEGEYFALVETGRKGLDEMFVKMGDELREIAAPTIRERLDTWTTRALVEITSNDKLRPVIQTKEGIFSIYRALTKCAQMDLQIGGQFPHAHLVPYQGKATLILSAEGYGFASVHGQGAVLSTDPLLVEVYETDKCHIDQAAGTVEHTTDKAFDRGKLLGYYMILDYRNGHIEIPTITAKEVQEIITNYGNRDRDGKLGPAHRKSPRAMAQKTATKQLLKRPAKLSEGLAMLYASEDDMPAIRHEETEPETRNVTERVTESLSDATEALDPKNAVEPAESPEPEPEKSGEGGETPAGGKTGGPDLF